MTLAEFRRTYPAAPLPATKPRGAGLFRLSRKVHLFATVSGFRWSSI